MTDVTVSANWVMVVPRQIKAQNLFDERQPLLGPSPPGLPPVNLLPVEKTWFPPARRRKLVSEPLLAASGTPCFTCRADALPDGHVRLIVGRGSQLAYSWQALWQLPTLRVRALTHRHSPTGQRPGSE
ncbi:hypothetical protein [Streptomyces decoyicus]|uniref:hypothetical protein n=1 Tax=Streptomyces decoyicus TaxID=249567 RepID=UPI0038649DF4|nr:hypothetical protein OG532_39200 [Streptomyces decoyicus]